MKNLLGEATSVELRGPVGSTRIADCGQSEGVESLWDWISEHIPEGVEVLDHRNPDLAFLFQSNMFPETRPTKGYSPG